MLLNLVRQTESKLKSYLNQCHLGNLAIYGAGTAGEVIQNLLSDNYQIKYFIDEFSAANAINGLPIYKINDLPSDISIDTVIITVLSRIDPLDIVRKLVAKYHYQLNVINIRDFVCDEYKFELKKEIQDRYEQKLPIKLIIGSGVNIRETKYIDDQGWILTDIDSLNICDEADWKIYFEEHSIDAILAEHVFEHITQEQMDISLKYCYKYLKDEGYIRLAVPDGFHPEPFYINLVKPNGLDLGSEDHKVLYNYRILEKKIENIGFKVHLLEWYDESGCFHCEDWDETDGKIKRSERFYSGWFKGYTSLMLDIYKKGSFHES